MAMNDRYTPPRLLWLASLLLCLGCAPPPQIREYTIHKETPDRLLGGIALHGAQAWYFKITGPRKELDAQLPDIRTFLKSLRFTDNAEQPTWTLPSGWKLDPKERMGRIATIRVPLGESEAELSVTALPFPPQQDEATYLLANVNRWRDQLSQSHVTVEELAALEIIPAEGLEVRLVSISGKQKASTGMTPPFAS